MTDDELTAVRGLERQIESLTADMDRRFESVERRIDGLDERNRGQDAANSEDRERLARVEADVGHLRDDMGRIAHQMEGHGTTLSGLAVTAEASRSINLRLLWVLGLYVAVTVIGEMSGAVEDGTAADFLRGLIGVVQ